MIRMQLSPSQLVGVEKGKCPDCSGQLLAGPCGGASQNVLCSACLEEFNLMRPFGVDRMGKNPARARQVYGVSAQPIAMKLWFGKAESVAKTAKKSFLWRLFSLTSR